MKRRGWEGEVLYEKPERRAKYENKKTGQNYYRWVEKGKKDVKTKEVLRRDDKNKEDKTEKQVSEQRERLRSNTKKKRPKGKVNG